MARENSGWGYDRIVGAFANLKDNRLLTPLAVSKGLRIPCHPRLGGLLKFYARCRMNILALPLRPQPGPFGWTRMCLPERSNWSG
jgi:hypothetical protein